MENEDYRKGAKTKLFGVGLIFLAGLDSMLSWRGGLVASDFYIWLFVAGIILYIVGAIRANETQSSNRQSTETQAKLQR